MAHIITPTAVSYLLSSIITNAVSKINDSTSVLLLSWRVLFLCWYSKPTAFTSWEGQSSRDAQSFILFLEINHKPFNSRGVRAHIYRSHSRVNRKLHSFSLGLHIKSPPEIVLEFIVSAPSSLTIVTRDDHGLYASKMHSVDVPNKSEVAVRTYCLLHTWTACWQCHYCAYCTSSLLTRRSPAQEYIKHVPTYLKQWVNFRVPMKMTSVSSQ